MILMTTNVYRRTEELTANDDSALGLRGGGCWYCDFVVEGQRGAGCGSYEHDDVTRNTGVICVDGRQPLFGDVHQGSTTHRRIRQTANDLTQHTDHKTHSLLPHCLATVNE